MELEGPVSGRGPAHTGDASLRKPHETVKTSKPHQNRTRQRSNSLTGAARLARALLASLRPLLRLAPPLPITRTVHTHTLAFALALALAYGCTFALTLSPSIARRGWAASTRATRVRATSR